MSDQKKQKNKRLNNDGYQPLRFVRPGQGKGYQPRRLSGGRGQGNPPRQEPPGPPPDRGSATNPKKDK